jgi:hypothetical protein
MIANHPCDFYISLSISLIRKLQYKLALIIILTLIVSNSSAQLGSLQYTSLGELYKSGSAKVELLVAMSATPCAQLNTQNIYKLRMTGIKNTFSGRGYFLNWKMRITQCNGDILLKNCSISLDTYNTEGDNDDFDWDFSGTLVETPIVAEISRNPNTQKDRIIRDVKSISPNYIIGDSVLLTGQSTTLKIVGGTLGTNAKWAWFDSCGGKIIAEGSSITVSPTVSSTYYVRAISPNDSTSCIFKTVEIDDNSRLNKQSKIIGPTQFCGLKAQEIQLEAFGGRKGYKATWVWYRDSCGSRGSLITKADRIKDVINKTTTYYARLEGPSGFTDCLTHKVIVTDYSIKPQEIIGMNEVCEDEDFTLQIKGGTLANDPNARWVWATSPDFKNELGFGDTLRVNRASQNATYYVRAEGTCNKTELVNKPVIVKYKSVKPNDIKVERVFSKGNNKRKGKPTNQYNFEIIGGSLGNESKWYWYKKLDSIQSGTETTYKNFKASLGSNTITVIAKGDCNQTEPIEKEFQNYKYNSPNTQFGFFNVGVINQDFSNLIFTAGTKNLYFRYKNTSSQSGINGKIVSSYECTQAGLLNFPIDNVRYFEFTGNHFTTRSSYTGGILIGTTPKYNRNKEIKSKANARLYIGGGHGSIRPMWETRIVQYANGQSETKWALNTQYMVEGVEAEIGVFIRFGHFNLMGGMNVILGESSKKYFNSTVGIGVDFY